MGVYIDDASHLTERQLEVIWRETSPGEMVCWVGSEPGSRYWLQRLIRIAFLLLCIAVTGVFAIYMILMNPTFLRNTLINMLPVLTPILLTIIVGYLLIEEIFQPRKDSPDLYAITTRRALIISSGRNRGVWSYGPEALKVAQIKRRRDGSGDIIFEHGTRWGTDTEGRSTHQVRNIGFYGLISVDKAFNQFQQIDQSLSLVSYQRG